jgi:hypothetical protein
MKKISYLLFLVSLFSAFYGYHFSGNYLLEVGIIILSFQFMRMNQIEELFVSKKIFNSIILLFILNEIISLSIDLIEINSPFRNIKLLGLIFYTPDILCFLIIIFTNKIAKWLNYYLLIYILIKCGLIIFRLYNYSQQIGMPKFQSSDGSVYSRFTIFSVDTLIMFNYMLIDLFILYLVLNFYNYKMKNNGK